MFNMKWKIPIKTKLYLHTVLYEKISLIRQKTLKASLKYETLMGKESLKYETLMGKSAENELIFQPSN